MKLRVLIADDEPLARERLRGLLAEEPDVEIVGESADGWEAVRAVRATTPDVLFLDVQMPGLDGFGVVETLGPGTVPAVVFVTAFDRFAIRAFEVHAVDYLLKPFDRSRFREALARAAARVGQSAPAPDAALEKLLGDLKSQIERPRRLAIKEQGRILFLDIEEIDWIEGDDNYAVVHVGPGSHRTRETLTALERRLPAERFVRVSRSAIVNVERVREMHPMFHGDQVVILKDGTKVPVSRGHRARLVPLLGRDS